MTFVVLSESPVFMVASLAATPAIFLAVAFIVLSFSTTVLSKLYSQGARLGLARRDRIESIAEDAAPSN